jgi:hypothetical protein
MKILVKLFIIFSFLISTAKAQDILVIPADLLQTKENYYRFDEPSEIVANDVINEFNKTNGKIKSFDLYYIRAKFNNNTLLKNALNNFKNNEIDYDAFKTIGRDFGCNYILLINSSVMTNKNSLKRNLWEVLEVSTNFEINYPFRLDTSAILIDTSNGIVTWSNNFSTKLGSNSNDFVAKNIAQASAEYEKIKLYSKTIIAPSVSQNITLRFFPKSIRPLQTEIQEGSGGALRFERTIPEKPNLKPRTDFYGDDVFGI